MQRTLGRILPTGNASVIKHRKASMGYALGIDLGDQPEAIDPEDELGDILSVEVHADLPGPEPAVREHQVVFDDEFERPDEEDDHEDLFDVGE